jgi:hypothetical protein
MNALVDMRSDTVTQPTAAMRAAKRRGDSNRIWPVQ